MLKAVGVKIDTDRQVPLPQRSAEHQCPLVLPVSGGPYERVDTVDIYTRGR